MTSTRRIATATAAAALGLSVGLAPAAHAAPSTDSLGPAPAGCAVDTEKLAKEAPKPSAEHPGWTVAEHVNECGNLGYVLLETTGGTVSSPSSVILLHRGKPVATQPAHDVRIKVGSHSDFHVELGFQQRPAEGQANADARYQNTAYVWNPLTSDVNAVGPLPEGS